MTSPEPPISRQMPKYGRGVRFVERTEARSASDQKGIDITIRPKRAFFHEGMWGGDRPARSTTVGFPSKYDPPASTPPDHRRLLRLRQSTRAGRRADKSAQFRICHRSSGPLSEMTYRK